MCGEKELLKDVIEQLKRDCLCPNHGRAVIVNVGDNSGSKSDSVAIIMECPTCHVATRMDIKRLIAMGASMGNYDFYTNDCRKMLTQRWYQFYRDEFTKGTLTPQPRIGMTSQMEEIHFGKFIPEWSPYRRALVDKTSPEQEYFMKRLKDKIWWAVAETRWSLILDATVMMTVSEWNQSIAISITAMHLGDHPDVIAQVNEQITGGINVLKYELGIDQERPKYGEA